MPGFYNALLAIVMTLLAISVLRPLAQRLGLVDHPGGRKAHEGLIPLIGGIAMFVGFSFALLTLPISLGDYRSFLAASLLLVMMGLLDDFHELSPKHKLLAQLIAGILITVWGKTILYSLGNLFFVGNIYLGLFAIPLTLFAVLGIINAVNLVDGVDGLAGTLALIQMGFFYLIAHYTHRIEDIKILLLLMGVISSYLIFNFPTPWERSYKIFMGDAGSMFLGLALVWFAIRFSQGTKPPVTPVTMLWILAMPLLDTLNAIIRRIARGHSPLRPDQGHFHHVLKNAGCTPLQVIIILGGCSIATGVIGLAGYYYGESEALMFLGFLVLLGTTFLIPSIAGYIHKTVQQ